MRLVGSTHLAGNEENGRSPKAVGVANVFLHIGEALGTGVGVGTAQAGRAPVPAAHQAVKHHPRLFSGFSVGRGLSGIATLHTIKSQLLESFEKLEGSLPSLFAAFYSLEDPSFEGGTLAGSGGSILGSEVRGCHRASGRKGGGGQELTAGRGSCHEVMRGR